MSNQQAQNIQQKPKQKYELQSNCTTIIITHSMRKIDDAWIKSSNCELYQFNTDGSKFFVNKKRTPSPKNNVLQLHYKGKTIQKPKQKKPKLSGVAEPVTREVRRKRDTVIKGES